MSPRTVTVYGAGSWGTTLSLVLAEGSTPVALWPRDPRHGAEIERTGENTKYLPGIPFPGSIRVLREATPPAPVGDVAVLAVPSHGLAELAERIPDGPATKPALWVIATKGLEESTCRRMSELLAQTRGLDAQRIVVLAGPSLAHEVVERKPAAVLAASESPLARERVQSLFSTDRFRVYTSDDVVGVELATSLKNVIALAAGMADGLGLGRNARGALLTRGLAEITRLGTTLGAKLETFLGLAGVGDLVTTCTSPLSRNHTLGEQLARGIALDQALADLGQVAEGVRTTRAAWTLARRVGVEVPITQQVHRILFDDLDPSKALHELMTRPLRSESR